MIVGEVVNDWRRAVNEPNTNRFTVQDSLDFFNKSQRDLMFELDFPEATYQVNNGVWAGGVREYALLENYKIVRVYAVAPNGAKQILSGTNIGIMEGDITQSYDNTSGVYLGQPVQTPQWIANPVVSYPVQSGQIGGIHNTTGAFGYNDAPRYYLRGGNIGIVPVPATPITIEIDYLPNPPIVKSLDELSIFPYNCMNALTAKMAEYSRTADNSGQAVKFANDYDREVKMKLQPWKDALQATKPKTFIPITTRSRLRGRYR